MAGIYGLLASYYDIFNSDIDYSGWADFAEAVFDKFFPGGAGKVSSVLDLGCGTGAVTIELARRGYDMIGADISPEMLTVAREKAETEGVGDRILWLLQDMRSFELYGTVEATVCALDGINHLLSPGDMRSCFSLVHNYLVPDGLFLFDVNTQYKFENLYADRSYVFNEKNVTCIWENCYNPKKKICDFYITLFERQRGGYYRKFTDIGRERMYSIRQISSALRQEGFDIEGIYADHNFGTPDEKTERIYIAARAKK